MRRNISLRQLRHIQGQLISTRWVWALPCCHVWAANHVGRFQFVPAYYSNRAAANIKEEYLGYAISDADKAIALDPKFIKAYYRRATANMGMSKLKEALKDFRSEMGNTNQTCRLALIFISTNRTVVKVVPNDADAKSKLVECEKELRRRQFESAIAVEEQQISALEKIGDIDSIIVEASYDGQHLPTDPVTKSDAITLDFITALMEDFRQQKRLHRKYAYKILRAVKEIFTSQTSLVDVRVPEAGNLVVCGDVHGQYYDLLNIFEQNGLPSEKNGYLFNGGAFSPGRCSD